jgi:antitoxin component of RelBE/YafQ-DinJ toxin-antitoxin module
MHKLYLKPDVKRNETIHIRLTTEEKERVEEFADRLNLSVSAAARLALINCVLLYSSLNAQQESD